MTRHFGLSPRHPDQDAGDFLAVQSDMAQVEPDDAPQGTPWWGGAALVLGVIAVVVAAVLAFRG
jgi:hypothetical protein